MPPAPPGRVRTPLLALRGFVFAGLVAGTTAVGVTMMWTLLRPGGFTWLEAVILGLFTVTFCWITIAFWTAMTGFVLVALRRDPLSLRSTPEPGLGEEPLQGRIALVMPVHNEDPESVTGRLAAVLRSLSPTGHADRFDAYLLSDTTDPGTAREEEDAWSRLRRDLGGGPGESPGLYYRRRSSNRGRKAGNIADFCQRWGTHYDFMVVLDADSLMEGEALVELARRMEANPDVGLIQTLPRPVRQETLFGRLLQFSRSLYGPMLATGLSFWQTDAGSYWGHNAIVRVKPFMDHCGLPVLPGSPPLGGEILSHDFVEGALLRRAGWKIVLLPHITGSYEEVPGNILDYAKRDRRWSQGNLQHLRLVSAPGLHRVSRAQFVLGAMSYLVSPLWLAMLLSSTAYTLLPNTRVEPPLRAALDAGTQAAGSGAGVAIPLLISIVVVLFLPKGLALGLAAVRHPDGFGGVARLLVSGLVEMIAAVVVTPLMMMYHSYFVISILRGKNVEWGAQERDGRVVSWKDAWRKTCAVTALGVGWAALTLSHSTTLFLWLSPVFAGLLLSAPLVRWTSRRSLGDWAGRRGIFLVPTETAPPSVLVDSYRRVEAESAPSSGAGRSWSLPPERPRAMAAQPLARRREGWLNAEGAGD